MCVEGGTKMTSKSLHVGSVWCGTKSTRKSSNAEGLWGGTEQLQRHLSWKMFGVGLNLRKTEKCGGLVEWD